MTPRYFESEWADFELNWHFVDTHLRQGADPRLIPVLLRPCAIPTETSAIHRIDMTSEHREAGYRDLQRVLSRADALAINAYSVPPGPSSRYLGDFVAGKLELLLAFPERRVHDFVTVYTELIQNAFEHAHKRDNRVEASVWASPAEVVLEVSDSGTGFNLGQSILTTRDIVATNPTAVGPRGLYLVNEICDRLTSDLKGRRHVVRAVLRREKITKQVSDLAKLAPIPLNDLNSSPQSEHTGPWFLRFVDPAGRYACLAIKIPRVDHDNAEDVRGFFTLSLESRSFPRVIVDCSDVAYISSAGLGALMVLAKRVRSAGGTVALVVRHPSLMEILEISRFALLFEIYHSLKDALGPLG
jgi:anti-anti-sigma factor